MRDLDHREDLPFLFNELGLTGKGVEVGVLRGEFSRHILQYWKGQKLYCIDAWRHLDGVIDINNPDHNGHLNNLAEAFKALYGLQNRATLIRELSGEAADLFPNKSLDFVYIDAAHDFKNVCQDLQTWAPKVKPGGILAGHDYLNGTFDCGVFAVKQAVDEWAKEHAVQVHKTLWDADFPSWVVQL